MTELEITWLSVAAAILAISVVIVAWLRWRRRDQEFVGLTPGLFPSPEQRVGSRRVRGGQQWKGTVAVSFTPRPASGPRWLERSSTARWTDATWPPCW